eukprot:3008531-Amphidinium_carterae.2
MTTTIIETPSKCHCLSLEPLRAPMKRDRTHQRHVREQPLPIHKLPVEPIVNHEIRHEKAVRFRATNGTPPPANE